jgi:GGDEF domain-containing protein
MYVRRVETAEVVGTLLFIPVFLAFVYRGLVGGVAAGIAAALAYAAVRYPAIDAVGAGRFVGLMVSRSLAYLAFGAIGGWANQQLESSLTRLELYDQIDDYTGLFNARFFLQDTDLEMSRSRRYQTIFSLSIVEVPAAPLMPLSRRQRVAIRRELGRMLQDAVRTVDRPIHGFDGTTHHFAVVLPETGSEGAQIFTNRLADRLAEYMASKGVSITADQVVRRWITFPDDGEAVVQELRATFAEIDRHEHPEGGGETPASTAGPTGDATPPASDS